MGRIPFAATRNQILNINHNIHSLIKYKLLKNLFEYNVKYDIFIYDCHDNDGLSIAVLNNEGFCGFIINMQHLKREFIMNK